MEYLNWPKCFGLIQLYNSLKSRFLCSCQLNYYPSWKQHWEKTIQLHTWHSVCMCMVPFTESITIRIPYADTTDEAETVGNVRTRLNLEVFHLITEITECSPVLSGGYWKTKHWKNLALLKIQKREHYHMFRVRWCQTKNCVCEEPFRMIM